MLDTLRLMQLRFPSLMAKMFEESGTEHRKRRYPEDMSSTNTKDKRSRSWCGESHMSLVCFLFLSYFLHHNRGFASRPSFAICVSTFGLADRGGLVPKVH